MNLIPRRDEDLVVGPMRVTLRNLFIAVRVLSLQAMFPA